MDYEFWFYTPKGMKKAAMDIYRTFPSIILLYVFNINLMKSIWNTGQPNSYIFRGIYQVLLCETIYIKTILWIPYSDVKNII